MAATSDSDDELDPVTGPNDDDDAVVSCLERKQMTNPSAEASNPVVAEDFQVTPSVVAVDEAWKGESLRVFKTRVYEVPFDLLIHAPALGRDGVPLSRVSMSLSHFSEASTARSAVAKALVHEHGATFIASRLIFVKMTTTKTNAVAAFLPVTLTGVDSAGDASELEGGVPIFAFPNAEVQSLLNPSTSSASAIPKDFAKKGAWDLVQPAYAREAKAWALVGERTSDKPRSRPKRPFLLDDPADGAKKAKEGTPVAEPSAERPGWPAVVDGGAIEAFAEAVTKTFLLKPDDKERTGLPITIPPGVVARVTVELRAA